MSDENGKKIDNDMEQLPQDEEVKTSRRNFLKAGLIGAGAAAAVATGTIVLKRVEGIPQDEFPVAVKEDFKSIDQKNQINVFCYSKKLNEEYPERNKIFNDILKKEDPINYKPFNFHETRKAMLTGPYKDAPGYRQIDRALAFAGFSAAFQLLAGQNIESPNRGVGTWNQIMLSPVKYQFSSPQEANKDIKRAAKLFGTVACGITKRDRRWDYDPLYDSTDDKELSWEKDFPFEPKTVIVLITDMDYEATATAPSNIQDGTVGDAYSRAIKAAGQMAIFIRQLGFKAVASMNDMGVNAPYAVAAGLGEGGRNGQVIIPEYGPRVRISKVYTDFEFVEYDKPRTFGVASFCLHCKRCADSCPANAISQGDPSWGPEYSDDPNYTWNACKGIFKYHNDAQRCAKFWIDNDGSCGNCIASCPYNKPDFWHHRLVDAGNVISPGPVHSLMREMDILFGYGNVSDPTKVERFWK